MDEELKEYFLTLGLNKCNKIEAYKYAKYFLNEKVNEIVEKHVHALAKELRENNLGGTVSVSLYPSDETLDNLSIPHP